MTRRVCGRLTGRSRFNLFAKRVRIAGHAAEQVVNWKNMNTIAKYSEQASFYRIALQLGLISGRTVVEWAEKCIENESSIPHSLIDISETSEWDITRFRHLLLEVCLDEKVNITIVYKILRIIYLDIKNNKRNLNDTMTVLTQMRQFVKIDPIISEQIKKFEIQYGTIPGELIKDNSIEQWLMNFEHYK
jgi:hypothetical protein